MVIAVCETNFLEHSPENRCPLYVLYKIPLTQANFFTHPTQNALALASGWELASLIVLGKRCIC